MGRLLQILFVAVTVLSAVPAIAGSSEREMVESVVITRDLSVEGDKLCHDGRYLYHKAEAQDCRADSACEKARIAPIYQVERVNWTPDFYITQFYKVDLEYQRRVIVPDEDGKYTLVENREERVQICQGMSLQKKKNIVAERDVTEEEQIYIYALLNNNISVINSPLGEIRSFRSVNVESHEGKYLSLILKTNLGSPLCDERPALQEFVHMLGGEFSGNGWHKVNMDHLQSSSASLKVKVPKKGKSEFDKLLDASMSCVKTVEI